MTDSAANPTNPHELWKTQNGGVIPFELIKTPEGKLRLLIVKPYAQRFLDTPTTVPIEVDNFEWKNTWEHNPGHGNSEPHCHGIIAPDGSGYWARSEQELTEHTHFSPGHPAQTIPLINEKGIDKDAVRKAFSDSAIIPFVAPNLGLRAALEEVVTQNLSAAIEAQNKKEAQELEIRKLEAARRHEEELRQQSLANPSAPKEKKSPRRHIGRVLNRLPRIPADPRWNFLKVAAARGEMSAAAHSAPPETE